MYHILIPLGGMGKRFKNVGFYNPKPLINVAGKPILYWLLDCLKIDEGVKIIIPYNEELYKYGFENKLRKDYPHLNFVFIQLFTNTRGAAETIYIGTTDLEDYPIMCLDGDSFYKCDIVDIWRKKEFGNMVTVIHDKDNNPYSYVSVKKNRVIDIKEKVKISDLAITGCYCFRSVKMLRKYIEKILKENIVQFGEFYMSGVVKEMLKYEEVRSEQSELRLQSASECEQIVQYEIVNGFVSLGTPEACKSADF
jgi:dTDP-glucose pyrophosphorylase